MNFHYATRKEFLLFSEYYTQFPVVPCGLVVRMWRSHRHGPGSIPGMGTSVNTKVPEQMRKPCFHELPGSHKCHEEE